jgi:hypothetical protein
METTVPNRAPAKHTRASGVSNMLTYVSVLIIVGTELYGIAFAFAWAIGGFFELGSTITNALYFFSFAAVTWAMYVFAKTAYGVDERLEAQKNARKAQSEPG